MKVQVYASLKDYFAQEFEIADDIPDIQALQNKLQNIEPGAEHLLKRCRYAVSDEFVNKDYKIDRNDTVFIIPPSSGG